MFNTEWHKISLQVLNQEVSLFVDCAKMQTVPLGISMEILKVYRGSTTDSSGMTGICMQDNDAGTQADMVSVDLQWFVLYCDKNRPAKDTCDEFYETTTQIDYLPADEDVTSFPPLDVDDADLIPDPVGLKERECGRCREEEIDDIATIRVANVIIRNIIYSYIDYRTLIEHLQP